MHYIDYIYLVILVKEKKIEFSYRVTGKYYCSLLRLLMWRNQGHILWPKYTRYNEGGN